MNFQPLVAHYLQQWQVEYTQAKEVRQILQDAYLTQADERITAALNGEMVTYRGAREWHVAGPVETRGKTGDGVPAYHTKGLPAYATIASDGSQVMPDSRHRYPWAIVRVAAFTIFYNQLVDEHRSDRMIGPDDERILAILSTDSTREERNAAIGGLRDSLELDLLVEETVAQAGRSSAPVLSMVDGPLHIFRPDNDRVGAAILGTSLSRITAAGALPVGIIDGGEARYTVRLAALLANDDEKRWPAVSDFDVWLHLEPGERSPLFRLHSICNQQLVEAGFPPINFFYLRTGERVMRIETPASSAADIAAISAIVTQDCLGNDYPYDGIQYPYALIKAHEHAVVTHREKSVHNQQFLAAMSAYGISDNMSAKETLKDL